MSVQFVQLSIFAMHRVTVEIGYLRVFAPADDLLLKEWESSKSWLEEMGKQVD